MAVLLRMMKGDFMSKDEKPVYFELEDRYAALIPTKDGGQHVIKDPQFSIADYMERGSVIGIDDLPEDFRESVDEALKDEGLL